MPNQTLRGRGGGQLTERGVFTAQSIHRTLRVVVIHIQWELVEARLVGGDCDRRGHGTSWLVLPRKCRW